MDRDELMGIAKRMLELIDTRSTNLAPEMMDEPVAAYTSADRLAAERRKIFGAGVHFLGLSGAVPAAGSWRTFDLVDSPLLLVRDRDGEVHLYLNSCRHRGVKIVEGAGEAGRLACPFHNWTYDLEGRLVAVPEPEGFDGLCKDERGLIELPVAEWHGMIFGSPVPGSPIDVEEHLGGLGPQLASWGFESWQLYTEPHLHTYRGNWKFAWDTYCENYHFAFLHQETLKDYLIGRRQLVDLYGSHARMVSALTSIEQMRQAPEHEWEPGHHLSIQYRLFPSVSFSVFPNKLEVHWVLPGTTPDQGHGFHAVYVSEPPADDEARAALDAAIEFGCETVVNQEDLWVTERSVPGLGAPANGEHLVFGRNEPVVQHFHRAFHAAVEA